MAPAYAEMTQRNRARLRGGIGREAAVTGNDTGLIR